MRPQYHRRFHPFFYDGGVRRLVVGLGLVFLMLLAPAAATAGEGKKPAARAAAHMRAGLKHREAGRWDKAIDELNKAYQLEPDPDILFHIAEVYWAKGDAPMAYYYYSTYLELRPDAPNRADVETRLSELEPALPGLTADPQEAPASAPSAAPASARATDPTPALPPTAAEGRDRGRTLKLAGLVMAGGGVVLVATGAYFAGRAANASADLTELYEKGGTWGSHWANLYEEGQSAETTSVILFVAGGAALAGGGLLYYLGMRAERPPTVSLSTAPGGFTATVTCAF